MIHAAVAALAIGSLLAGFGIGWAAEILFFAPHARRHDEWSNY